MKSKLMALLGATAITSVAGAAAAQVVIVDTANPNTVTTTGAAPVVVDSSVVGTDSGNIDATLQGVSITETQGALTGGAVSSITDNINGATALGNNITSTIEVLSGGAATGELVIGSSLRQEASVSADVSNPTGTGADVTIGISVTDQAAGTTVSVDGNLTTATAAGTQGINTITGDLSQVVVPATADGVVGTTAGATAATAQVNSDIAIGSAQVNSGPTTDADIDAISQTVSTVGTLAGVTSVSGNDSTADANGNIGVNSVDGELSQASVSVGVGSSQANSSSVTASVGGNPGEATLIGAQGTLGISGVVTVDGNDLTADAVSNAVANSVSLALGADDAEVVVSSEQDALSPNGATVSDTLFQIVSGDGAATPADLSGEVTLSNNSAAAIATGSDGDNSISVAGVSAETDLLVENDQDTQGQVTATVGDLGVLTPGATVTGASISGVVTVDGNSFTAAAASSVADNQIIADLVGDQDDAADAGTQVAGGEDIAITSDQNAASTSASVSTTGIVVTGDQLTATGVIGVSGNEVSASSQANDVENDVTATIVGSGGDLLIGSTQNGDLSTASVTGANIQVNFGDGVVVDGVVSIDQNTVSASAGGNTGVNTMSVDGVGDARNAAIDSGQTQGGSVSATIGQGPTGGANFVVSAGIQSISDTVSITGNTVSTIANANNVTNALTLAGVSNNSTGSVTNVQTNNASVSATTGLGGGVANLTGGTDNFVVTAGAVTGSISIDGNIATAMASGNLAINSIAASISTASGPSNALTIANDQANTTSISSSVTGLNVGITSGDVTGGVTSIAGNSASATSIGNQGSNTITVGN